MSKLKLHIYLHVQLDAIKLPRTKYGNEEAISSSRNQHISSLWKDGAAQLDYQCIISVLLVDNCDTFYH